MARIDVKGLGGETLGDLELPDVIFSGKVNEALLWEAVKHYRAALRQGTHATKNKKLVSGSGKKLWKQKGTGRARVGSVRSPIWRHGGTVHGPQPRSYEYQFPRKKLLGALRSALVLKFAEGKLIVVENYAAAEAKTKLFRQALDRFEAKKTALLVESSQQLNEKVYLGTRNLAGVELVLSSEVHPYDLLRYEYAIFSKAALEALQETLMKNLPRQAATMREAA